MKLKWIVMKIMKKWKRNSQRQRILKPIPVGDARLLDGLPVLLPGHDNGLVPGSDGAEDREALVLLEGLARRTRGLKARGR